jgi:hypothetical protein
VVYRGCAAPPIDHDKRKFGLGDEKIIDIPKQDKLVDTGGPPYSWQAWPCCASLGQGS